jgi:ubiquinone/menaquinone biosynthesis C-methylase UbiE
VQASAFDVTAPGFDRHRALPDGVPEAIRSAILAAVDATRPRLLDLGAGTGRIGIAFVAAGDDYVGVDLSLAMLRAFVQRRATRLVQADGAHLPFPAAIFDAVMLIQAFGGTYGWRRLLAETRRVLRPAGALVVGRAVAPADGLDARMKQHLTTILDGMGVAREGGNRREEALRFLEQTASGSCVNAAAWEADRTPRGFLERHRTGARFAALPAPIKDAALAKLAAWASATFGSLDRASREPHYFELRVFRFQTNGGR